MEYSTATVGAALDTQRLMPEGVVNSVAYSDGRRIGDVDIHCLGGVWPPNVFVWIGLYEPSQALLQEVQAQLGLHDLAIEDAHQAHQRPKVERYGDGLFVVMRTAQMNPDAAEVEYGETHIFVGCHYLVSVRHGPSQSYSEVRARVEATPRLLRLGPGFALYALMDFIVDQYLPIIDALQEQIDLLEEQIFGTGYSRDTTTRIYHLQRELLQLKRVISPLIDLCNRITRFDQEVIAPEIHVYFRDVYDHVVRANEMVDTLRELLATALEANFSLISIHQNEVMKRFAGWAAIIAIPTMIAGIYGMNFEQMPELGWSYGYPAVISVTVTLCVALYLYFRHAHWL
ncbi:MAG: magnesium/cobalt transporter CorA [Anaerolineae bacterium]